MKILVINCGSSSIKYQLIQMTGPEVLASGLVERIGEPEGDLVHKVRPGQPAEQDVELTLPMDSHTDGLSKVVELLTDTERGVIQAAADIAAVGHRVVHGGEAFHRSMLVTDEVVEDIRENIPLAPLHNPANLEGIQVARKIFPDAAQVAVFDTAFHQTMPPEAYMYALPYDLYRNHKIRKYGFHGTSHKYVATQAAKLLEKPLEELNAVTIHLGNGASMAAVRGGKSVETSMGMTPLDGLIMGTRCGDIDPAVHPFLGEHRRMDLDQVETMLNKESGLKGVCGMNDMRDIHAAVGQGDEQAQLAVGMYAHRIKLYLGAYYAVLGRVDAMVFTAGVGENDPVTRANVCQGLEHLGIEIEEARNVERSHDPRLISPDASRVAVMVIPTNEELEIANQTVEVLQETKG
jgi:acetate kinase